MRHPAFATLAWLTLTAAAAAQSPPPTAPSPARPKPAATAPVRPALQTPDATATAMTQAERLAIQSDLAWAGDYNGAITGEVSARMVAAIRLFQKSLGAKETGVLNPQERATLADAARKRQAGVGWKMVQDPLTGARLGVPGKLAPQMTSDANGTRWASPTGTIQILLARRRDAATTAKLAEAERMEAGRKLDYSAVKPDFYVLAGLQGLKKFYLRGQVRDGEVRTLTILYDQAVEGTMAPVVVAMSSAFNAFAGMPPAPPPRRPVEYSTGVVASADGAVIADRAATEGCVSLVVAGHGSAERIVEKAASDKSADLAVLRLYGARGLSPLRLDTPAARQAVDLIGIADPQSQGGGNAASAVKAQIVVHGEEASLTPPPGAGFSGAAVRDGDGNFAGIAVIRTVTVAAAPVAAVAQGVAAAPAPALPSSQATLIRAEVVRDVVSRNGVVPATGPAANGDARASVVRVICVRK